MGYTAVDADHGYCAFINRETGEEVTGPTLEIRTPEWLKAHVWRFIPAKIDELRERARHELIFLCGNTRDDGDYLEYFTMIFALIIDDETLTKRLRERPGDHSYGKSDHELKLSLIENAESQGRYAKMGATFIDATKPLDEIIDIILRGIES